MYSLPELQEKLFELSGKCYRADKEYIEAREQLDLLDDIKKIVFEQIVDRQHGDKINYREHMARLSPDWSEWLKSYAVIRKAEAEARLMRDKYRRDWETCRSLLSAIKKEIEAIPYEK